MGFPYPYPLGLPKGTVRATITLLLSINLVLLTLSLSPIAESLSTMVAVAITFYFGGRMRGIQILPRDTDPGKRAWGLPAGTIRTILFLLFVGISGYLFWNQGTVPPYLQEIVNIIFGYLLGRSFNVIRRKFFQDIEHNKDKNVSFIDHIKALAVIAIVSAVAYLTLFDDDNQYVELVILLGSVLLGFYFGERD